MAALKLDEVILKKLKAVADGRGLGSAAALFSEVDCPLMPWLEGEYDRVLDADVAARAAEKAAREPAGKPKRKP